MIPYDASEIPMDFHVFDSQLIIRKYTRHQNNALQIHDCDSLLIQDQSIPFRLIFYNDVLVKYLDLDLSHPTKNKFRNPGPVSTFLHTPPLLNPLPKVNRHSANAVADSDYLSLPFHHTANLLI